MAAAAARRQRGGGGGGQRCGSAAVAGMAVAAAATAVLPSRAAAVETKTPAATAIGGAQTTINNQSKAATATATETATMTATTLTMKMKATAAAAAAAAWQQCGGGIWGSEAAAQGWWPAWRRGRQLGRSAALAAAVFGTSLRRTCNVHQPRVPRDKSTFQSRVPHVHTMDGVRYVLGMRSY
jgi:hypothetical protein